MDSRNDKNIKIFLVDDDELTVKLTRFHLRLQGYEDVSTYSNGLACLNNLVYKPQVIFLDKHMDDMPGLEVLKKIKDLDSSIYVAIFSGDDNPQVIADFKKNGANEYVVKGLDAMKQIENILRTISIPA
jgi:DNA-binding NarL/FixJ family response regulator